MHTPSQIRERFIQALTEDFKHKVPDFTKLQHIIENEIGGKFVNDHAAIRVADPKVAELIKEAMTIMDFEQVGNYHFPDKKLRSYAYHVKGNHGEFSLFQSNVDLDDIPDDVREKIEQDSRNIAEASDHTQLKDLIKKATEQGCLSEEDTENFVSNVIDKLLSRNGIPVRRSTMDMIADRISPVLAAGIALGPDVNHITIDLKKAGFSNINQAYERMEKDFDMLDEIKHAPGNILDQSAAKPAQIEFDVEEDDKTIGKAIAGLRFIEIIWRGKVTEENVDKCALPSPIGKDYPYFEASNANKLFEGAKLEAS